MRLSRNDPCPCGSGKKYKLCCGMLASAATTPQTAPPGTPGALAAMINQGRLGEAERGAGALLKDSPDSGLLWKILGVALAGQGKDALPALRRAAELLPDNAEAQRNLGAVLLEQRQWEE